MRERVYPGRVARRAMTQAEADLELGIMRDILLDYAEPLLRGQSMAEAAAGNFGLTEDDLDED